VPAVTAPKKPRTGAYSSPTHASAMKIVDPTTLRRVASGSLRFGTSSVSPSRAPTPPPPAVDWATAAHELSKLLIPTERTTTSHTATELALPKIRKERHSTIGLTSVAPAQTGRQLRERSKAPTFDVTAEEDEIRPSRGREDRRKTIAVSETPAAPTRDERLMVRRRSSAGSTISTVSTVSARPLAKAGAAPGVAVKKTRGATRPVGPEVRKASNTSVQNLTQRFQQAKISPAASASSSDVLKTNGNANVAKATTGTQRLKINVPSEVEYASRQQKSTAARKAPAVKAPRVVAPKKLAAKVKISPPAEPATTPAHPVDTPTIEPTTSQQSGPTSQEPSQAITAGRGLITPPQALAQQIAPSDTLSAPNSSSGFSHDPLSFQVQPQIVVPTQELTWATPYAGPPSNFKSSPIEEAVSPTAGRAQQIPGPKPPVFSSSGYIPFGPAAPTGAVPSENLISANTVGEAGSDPQKDTHGTDIWDVPSTPAN
jgi:histone deacetylase HOS3